MLARMTLVWFGPGLAMTAFTYECLTFFATSAKHRVQQGTVSIKTTSESYPLPLFRLSSLEVLALDES